MSFVTHQDIYNLVERHRGKPISEIICFSDFQQMLSFIIEYNRTGGFGVVKMDPDFDGFDRVPVDLYPDYSKAAAVAASQKNTFVIIVPSAKEGITLLFSLLLR